jgi:hypothetical protein
MRTLFTAVFCLALVLRVFSQPCLPGGIVFLKQNQVDSFHINYPGCTMIGGKVNIGHGIKNLNGLKGLKSIGGSLMIEDVDSLATLAGLDSLTTIGGLLYIRYNEALTSLAGLEHLQAGSITDLTICQNPSLSTCGFPGICSWLSSPNGVANIYYNAPGCNNIAEIVDGCGGTFTCLPHGNYYFLSQNDIDNFQVHYPACTHLNGNVTIIGDDIKNLHGLNEISDIAGNLSIGHSNYLTPKGTGLSDLAGLDALEKVYDVEISNNNHLKNLSGLNSLKNTGNFALGDNDSLVSITGLSSLKEVDHFFYIIGNRSITNLAGMDSLNTAGDLWIRSNDKLTDIGGFPSLRRVFTSLEISENPSLVMLNGFNKLNEVYVLDIYNNDKLNSLAGLNSLNTIHAHLNLKNNRSLPALSGLESLAIVNGDMTISRNDALKSLDGLDSLKAVNGALEISYNDSLGTLNGLISIDSIGKLSVLYCPGLVSLQGLESLKYSAKGISIGYNNRMANLGGLEGLTAFDPSQAGGLGIYSNPVLANISAIAHLNSGSIRNLFIINDSLLTYCAIASICDYLRIPGLATIRDNGDGCNSKEQVLSRCDSLPVDNITKSPYLLIFPNPVRNDLTVELRDHSGQFAIMDLNGLEMLKKEITGQKATLDVSSLPVGIYLVKVVGEHEVGVAKLIKH